jgi:hypothetical protein
LLDDFSTRQAARNDTLRARMPRKYLSTLMTIKPFCSLVVAAFAGSDMCVLQTLAASGELKTRICAVSPLAQRKRLETERTKVQLTIMDGRVVYEEKK